MGASFQETAGNTVSRVEKYLLYNVLWRSLAEEIGLVVIRGLKKALTECLLSLLKQGQRFTQFVSTDSVCRLCGLFCLPETAGHLKFTSR